MRVKETKTQDDRKASVIELFAGVGGFRLGLEKAGWTISFANQWEPSTKSQQAFDCYVGHFPTGIHSNRDINEIVREVRAIPTSIPDADLLVGGFPCQDYSVAKTLASSKGLEGKKGVLWWQIRELVELKKPKFIFLENVDRLLKSPAKQRGRDFAVMLRTLGDLGYAVEWRVINGAEVGFPQRRIRVFIVAKKIVRTGTSFDAGSFLEKTGVFARAFPVAEIGPVHSFELDRDPVSISQTFGLGNKKTPFETSGYFIGDTVFTSKVIPQPPSKSMVLGDILQSDHEIGDEFWIDSSRIPEWEYQKGAKSITRTNKFTGEEFNYSEGKMAFPDLPSNPARTIITGEGGTSPSRFKHVVKTSRGFRRLTPIELERLNGFPDNWTQFDSQGRPISDVRRAFFMGNALIVGIIERIGVVLLEDLKSS